MTESFKDRHPVEHYDLRLMTRDMIMPGKYKDYACKEGHLLLHN
jgi:hypothetical protein